MVDENEIIDDILDNFDFEYVHDAMEKLGWCWARDSGGVPSISTLRKEARHLLKSCIGEDKYNTACGGLEVMKETHDGVPFYRLMFVLKDWSNYE